MTFTSLINFGGFGKGPTVPIERYHDDYHHGSRGSSKGKGGSSAALSALTLLAFLFLINVMQQSLEDNNSTDTTTATTFLLRDTQLPTVIDLREDKDTKINNDFTVVNTYDSPSKIVSKDYMRNED